MQRARPKTSTGVIYFPNLLGKLLLLIPLLEREFLSPLHP